MPFPSYIHTVRPDDPQCWPMQRQGINECGCTAPANALNLLVGSAVFDKDAFVRGAGMLFQRKWGGTPSFVTGQLIKRHGFGTHFGMLEPGSRELVLRNLIDQGVPVCIELGANKLGPLTIYGEHTIVLVGYSERYVDAAGMAHEEYYFVDAQYPTDSGNFGPHTNDVDRDGDGVSEHFPGNRTLDRADFLNNYPTGIYFPVFPTQQSHDAWCAAHIVSRQPSLIERFATGTRDTWRG